MHLGLGISICSPRAPAAASFDPATLSLTGFWQAGNYDGTTWTGTASAGNSGSHNLTQFIDPVPSVGAALNGHTVVTWDGVDDVLYGAACSTYFSTTALSGWELVKVPSIAGVGHNADTRFNNQIFCSAGSGQIWLYLADTGVVGIGVNDGGDKTKETTFTANAWQLVQYRHTGSALEIRVNAGAWQTRAVGTIATLANTMTVGRSIVNGYLPYSTADRGTANTAFSDADFDNVLTYCRARYGLALS